MWVGGRVVMQVLVVSMMATLLAFNDIPLRHCLAREISLLLFYFICKQYVVLPFFLTSLFMTMTSVL